MAIFVFSLFAYAVGMSSLIYFFWSLQFGDASIAVFNGHAMINDILLFMIFPLQHSLLARSFVKKRMNSYLHRPFYVVTSGIALWIVLLFWKPFGPTLYRDVAPIPFFIIYGITIVLIIWSTVELGHSQMFGLYHGYAAWKNLPLPSAKLELRGIYGIVRHPITSLLLVALWAHPTLTAGRLLWNALFTLYSVLGTVFEERSLIKEFGEDYQEYRRQVPAFFPTPATIRRR